MERKKRRNNSFYKPLLSSLLLCLCLLQLSAQMATVAMPMSLESESIDSATLPVITTLSSRNKEFASYMQQVQKSYQNISARRNFRPGFYLYTVNADDTSLPVKDLISLAARFTIPYEEIALLNDLTPNDKLEGQTLIIPNAAGLFVPLNPKNSLATLVKKRLYNPDGGNIYIIDGEPFQYHPTERITPTERAFFLDTNLRMPLDNSVLTSHYGKRVSPITGREHLHQGIDLAAPEGSKVFACQAGTISVATYDNIFGNYIIIQHENSLQSVYAHLSSMEVHTGDAVLKGGVIGRVGSTGASTGPHLHFEIRKNGRAEDPKNLLPAI